jgi:hypothetical protein
LPQTFKTPPASHAKREMQQTLIWAADTAWPSLARSDLT